MSVKKNKKLILNLRASSSILKRRMGLYKLFAARAFRKLLSVYVVSYFPFGFEGRMWDLIVSFYFAHTFLIKPFIRLLNT